MRGADSLDDAVQDERRESCEFHGRQLLHLVTGNADSSSLSQTNSSAFILSSLDILISNLLLYTSP